jgi:hypothetical protein
MFRMHRFFRFATRHLQQRGSALLVSMMVMVGLSLLGLAFITISETEGAISVNQRNHTQTLQVAESGAKMAVEWFQNPFWARDTGLAPRNVPEIKVNRNNASGIGQYKSTAGTTLFDRPYKPQFEHRFYGTEENPDILINRTTGATAGGTAASPADFLTQFNGLLFNNTPNAATADNSENMRVTEIRVYAPPIDGGTLNAQPGWTVAAGIPANVQGFWDGGSRFGIATIKVTASKFRPGSTTQAIARRAVKMVVAEWPFPGPQGPIQSNASITTGGNFQVHWGMMTSETDTQYTKSWTALPHLDAYNRAAIEYGYDANVFPVNPAAKAPAFDRAPWLWELIGRTFEDPWFEIRARGLITKPNPGPAPHPYKWTNPATNPETVSSPAYSSWFHDQTNNTAPDRREVLFPRMDYNFWKQVAISADSQANVYYLQYSAAPDIFVDRLGEKRTFRQWTDTTGASYAGPGPKSQPGFYFFDTANGLNPQQGGGGTLTGFIDMQGGITQMKGFIYANASTLHVKGLLGPAASAVNNWHYYNMPGEQYRDVGYRKADSTGTNWVSPVETIGAANGSWDFQDMPQVPGSGATGNGIFDYVMAQRAVVRNSSPTNINEWFIVPYSPTPANGGTCNQVGVDCSEPHEPYLNLIYPTPATYLGTNTVGWHNPADATRRRSKLVTAGTPVLCGAELGVFAPLANRRTDRANCTSNAYDRDGSVMRVDDMILDGVLYNEGTFEAQGNARYFGSLLVQGAVLSSQGNPDIFFDERLAKGQWPPSTFGFPRVFVSSVETDQ